MFKDPTTGQFTEAKALGQEIDLTVNYKYSSIVIHAGIVGVRPW